MRVRRRDDDAPASSMAPLTPHSGRAQARPVDAQDDAHAPSWYVHVVCWLPDGQQRGSLSVHTGSVVTMALPVGVASAPSNQSPTCVGPVEAELNTTTLVAGLRLDPIGWH